MMFDVAVIGDIYQDHVFSGFAEWPGPGQEIFTDQYEWEMGGGAVATACALGRLGHRVQLIGVAGDMDMPRITERLAHFCVSAEGIVASPVRTGITVSISTVHDRSFFTYRGANTELERRLLDNPDLLRKAGQARHVHLAMPLSTEFANGVIPLLREGPAVLSLDVGHHVGWLRDESSANVLRAVDYNMPNEAEATLMSGSPELYLQHCRTLGLQNALVKLGREGAVLLRDGIEYRAGSPTVSVVDTTAAGDVFDAGLIDALLDGAPPQQVLERACACGSMSTRAAGALGALPTRDELNAVLKDTYGS